MPFRIRIPSKAMLMGEYAVLFGVPAWVVATKPEFEWSSVQSFEKSIPPVGFAEKSPAGKLRKKISSNPSLALLSSSDSGHSMGTPEGVLQWPYVWQDPHNKKGGWGGSTAEWLTVYLWGARAGAFESDLCCGKIKLENMNQAWLKYRETFTSENPSVLSQFLIPSGADLVAQMVGQSHWFSIEPFSIKKAHWPQELEILLFSATDQPGRKVATHLALANENATYLSSLADPCGPFLNQARAIIEQAIVSSDPEQLGKLAWNYAELLGQFRLESEQAYLDRLYWVEQPGVYGAKGCGALLADVQAVWINPSKVDRVQLINKARERELKFVAHLTAGSVSAQQGARFE